jgi:integrase
MANRTKSARAKKHPGKPYDGFPLTAHRGTGRWCKKHRGKQYYFGPLVDWQAALAKYEREWPYIIDGREPPPESVGDFCTVAVLVDEFLNSKRLVLESGELTLRSFGDYFSTCRRMVEHFGKDRRVDDLKPADFETYRKVLADRYGVVALRNEINRCRSVFKYASDNRLIDRTVSYGQAFNRPSANTLRKARHESGPRMFEAAEIRKILDALDGKEIELDQTNPETGKPIKVKLKTDPGLRAMVLMAANCGFGQSDCASLPMQALDLDAGWCSFPRPKTGIPRRIPLWRKTVDALRKAIAERPDTVDPEDADCVFLTCFGNRWVRAMVSKKDPDRVTPLDALAQRFQKLLKTLHINGRDRLNFYAIRHTFQTIGGEAKDPDAVAAIMGHVDSSMGAVYCERISDERLRTVVDTVRAWLFPE